MKSLEFSGEERGRHVTDDDRDMETSNKDKCIRNLVEALCYKLEGRGFDSP
jgi:hypothetical protein